MRLGLHTKKIIAVIVLVTVCVAFGRAQNTTSSLLFDTTEWDFGTFRELDGTVSHTFSYTNKGSVPIVIERVKVDCGCTAPKYDRIPVAPGEKGTIEIVFDPHNYSGKFSKRITIYSDEGRNRNLLTVTGNVIGRPRSLEEDYPFALGSGLRADAMHRAFGYLQNGNVISMAIEVINTGGNTAILSLRPEVGSGKLKVVAPESLASGEKGTISLTYDLGSGEPFYGVLSDLVYIAVNSVVAELPLTASAIAVDDFKQSDPASAPICEVSPVYHHFGTVKQGDKLTKHVKITNTGKGPLIIRNVAVRRGTECSLRAGEEILPGKTIVVPVTLVVGDAYGTVAGGISIVVNDPEKPFREVKLGAELY